MKTNAGAKNQYNERNTRRTRKPPSQFTMIFSIRSGNRLFTHRIFSNRWLWLTIVLVVGLTLIVMLTPSLQSLFHLATLTSAQWWITVELSFGVLLLSELLKPLLRTQK